MDMLKRKQPKSSPLLLSTRARNRCRVLLSVALIFGLVATLPAVSHAAREKSCPGIHKRGKNWTGIELPEKEGIRLNGWIRIEIDPMDPRRIFLPVLRRDAVEHPFGYATIAERDVILGSVDGGCSWKTVLDMGERDLDMAERDLLRDSLPPETIKQVIAASDKGRERLYVVTHSDPTLSQLANTKAPGAPNLSRPNILMSRDNGKTWERPQEGFPMFGGHPQGPMRVRVAPWDPDVLVAALYNSMATLLADPDAPPSWFSFFKSTDGGRSWSELSPTPPSLDNPTEKCLGWLYYVGCHTGGRVDIDFEIDPIDKDVLWAIFTHPWNNEGVWRSADGGATWTQAVSPDLFPESCNPDWDEFRPVSIDVSHRQGEATHLLLRDQFKSDARKCIILSDDGGRTWHYLPELPARTDPLTGQKFNVETAWIADIAKDRFAFLGNDLKLYRDVGGGRRWAPLSHPFSEVVDQPNAGYTVGGWDFWDNLSVDDFRRRPALYLWERQDGRNPEMGGPFTIWKYQGRW